MRAHLVNPGLRVDRTFFDCGSDTKNHEMSFAHYTCPYCAAQVRFSSSNLERRQYEKSSNLDQEAIREFEALLPIEGGASFLDFHCPGCASPVRIAYTTAGGYAMGYYNYRIMNICEASDCQADRDKQPDLPLA